jgi:hypothetical protein
MVAPIVWFSSACAGPFVEGVRDYDHARYPAALERFFSAEPNVEGWGPRDRARYALYRGLTHLALGDRGAALHWLDEAERARNTNPSIFSDDERSNLAAALAHATP